MSYAERTRRPPRTLTDREAKRLLKVTGEAKAGYRDHVIISLALGCGLRESEIVALDVGDVTRDGRKPRRIIQLRVFKGAGKGRGREADFQRVHVPDATYYKLEKYLRNFDPRFGDSARRYRPDAPLFWSRQGNRLSDRTVRLMFHKWQKAAGFDTLYNFHTLRHTAITNVRRTSKDIRIAQKFARHVNIGTTVRYEHASDEEVAAAVKELAA